MTAPTYAWVDMADGLTDCDSGLITTSLLTLAHDIKHCQEITYDPATHTPAVAHDHDGTNSARLTIPSPNLIISSKWNDETNGNNFDDFESYNVTLGEDKEDGSAHFQTSGDVLACKVGGETVAANWGSGAKLACSLYIRSTGADSAGEIRFGLTNASTSTFITGCRGTVSYTQIGTGWKRLWFACEPGTVGTNLWFIARVATSFTNSLRVDAPAVTVGGSLSWWSVSPMLVGSGSDAINFFLRDISQNLPCFDQAVSMTDAVRLTPV